MKCRSIFFTVSAVSLSILSLSCNSVNSSSDPNSSSALSASFGTNSFVRSTNLEVANTVCMKDTVSIIALSGQVNIGGADTINGDVVALDNSSVQIGGSAHISGIVYLDSGATSHQVGSDTITGGVVQKDISNDQALITDFMTSLTSLTPTQSFDTISLTTTIQSTGALNVISIQELMLYGGQKLTLNGGALDIFILNVSGNLSTGGNSGIFLSGGLKPLNVIINNLGSGADVSIGGSDEINGTIFAYNRGIHLGGADTIHGALVAGNGVMIEGSNGIWSPQGFCGITAPMPGSKPTASTAVSGGCTDLICATGPF